MGTPRFSTNKGKSPDCSRSVTPTAFEKDNSPGPANYETRI